MSPYDPRIFSPLPGESPDDLADDEVISALEGVQDRVDLVLGAREQFTERLLGLRRGNFIQRIFANSQVRQLDFLDFSRGLGFGVGILIFAVVLVLSAGMAVWLAQLPSVLASKDTSSLAQIAVISVGLLVTVSLVSWASPKFLRGCVVPRVSGLWLLAWSGLSLIAGVGFGFLGAVISGGENGLSLTEISGGLGLLAAVGMNLILTPIFEEVLFRGVLFSALRQHLSFLPAALFSALAFGIVHLAPTAEGAVLIGAALWFALAFESTGSLLPCVIGHTTMNFMYGIA